MRDKDARALGKPCRRASSGKPPNTEGCEGALAHPHPCRRNAAWGTSGGTAGMQGCPRWSR
eukprot:5695071-Pyramimonas_sp.AAC.1